MKKNGNKIPCSGNFIGIYFGRKVTALFLLSIIYCSVAITSTFAQTRKYNISVREASVKDVLKQVRDQGGISFVYNEDHVASAGKVTLNLKDVSLKEVLEECLRGTNLSYEIKNDAVILKVVPKPVQAPLQQNQRTVKGKVVDERNAPLPGVYILFIPAGTDKPAASSTTDSKGQFAIVFPEVEGVLSFSFLSYESYTVNALEKEEWTIRMLPQVAGIEEIVVTGMFSNRKLESYTGSVTTVGENELLNNGSNNIIASIRNLDPSFNLIDNNMFGSDPNRLPEINIRGASSIPNIDNLREETRVALNTPLVILDGFQSTLQRLFDINENEVESISILKDAAATAIYGSRGANGVIVITTKTPDQGRLKVTYRSELGVEVADLSAYSILNARDKLELERKVGLYDRVSFGSTTVDNLIDLSTYYNHILNDVNRGVDTDWLRIPLQTGYSHRHNLRLEGGDKQFRYSGSVQLRDNEGVMKKSGRQAFNGTINLSYNYKDLSFSNSLLITNAISNESPYGSFEAYARMNPYWAPYDENGNVIKNLGDYGDNTYYTRWASSLPTNPLYNATLNTFDTNSTTEITNNTQVEWSILPELTARGRLGITRTFTQTDKFLPAEHTTFANYSEADIFRRGSYQYGVGNSFNWEASARLEYSNVFSDKHQVFAGVDFNIREREMSDYFFLAEGFTNSQLDFLSVALQYEQGGKPSGNEYHTRSVGLTHSLNYTFDNRYFADFNYRIDGSSQFGKESRFAPFWAAGLGWNIHKEKFFRNIDFINRLRIRGTIGTSGSEAFSSYQSLATYRYYTNDRYYNWVGSYMLALGNDELRWQQVEKRNFGVELHVLNGRFQFNAEVYKDITNDLVSSVVLPTANGFGSYIANIGSLENKGLEMSATAFIFRNTTQHFFWSVTGSLVQNKNLLVELSPAMKDAMEQLESNENAFNPNIQFREGYSSNTIWVMKSLGIDPSTGREIFIDKDGNKTFTWSANDLYAAGVTDPKYFGNINTMVRYKNLALNVSFGYRLGGQMYNQTLINKVENANYAFNVDSRVFNSRWSYPGDYATFKALLDQNTTYKSSRFVQDENTLTCQNINLKYDFDSFDFVKRVGAKSLSLTGGVSNLFYLSTVRQERGTFYPFAKTFTFSLTAIF